MNFDKPELIKQENKHYYFKRDQCELIVLKGNWVNSILVEDNCNKCNRMLGYYSKTGLKRSDRINVMCDDCK